MTLVSLIGPEQASAEVKALYEEGAAQSGTVFNTWQAIAHRPDALAAYLPYLRAVAGPGLVDQQTKELTALEVCLTNHCRYSTSHRVRAARKAGLEDGELRGLA